MSTGTSPRVIIDVQHHQDPSPPKRQRGRWAWTLSGVIVLLLGTVLLTFIIGRGRGDGGAVFPTPSAVHVITITQPVTSVSLQSYGSDIRVIGGGTSRVQVTETISYDPTQGPEPSVIEGLSGGRLTLTAPACLELGCSVGFTLKVPATVSVTAMADGGNIVVSGVAGANLDSGGGDVTATSVTGALTAESQGGNQDLAGIDGTLAAESGGGDVVVQGLTAPAATVTTDGGNLIAMGVSVPSATLSSGGGDAKAGFATPPDAVIVTTNGGNATVLVPGGPYSLTTDSGDGPPGRGAPQVVGIATSPTARATLTVITGGGSLVIEPGTGGLAPRPTSASTSGDLHPVPRAPRAPPAPRAPAAPRSAP